MSDYTNPEMNTERRICGRVRALILRDACRFCLNRDPEAFNGSHTCRLFGRAYPQCGSDGRALTFDPDLEAIKAVAP